MVAAATSTVPETPCRSSIAIRANTTEASPRGPNQPTKNFERQSSRLVGGNLRVCDANRSYQSDTDRMTSDGGETLRTPAYSTVWAPT